MTAGRDKLVSERDDLTEAIKRLRTAMRYPIIVDGRNLYEPAVMLDHGFPYLSIGRPAAMLRINLGRGRPVFVLRDIRHRARIEVIEGAHHKSFDVLSVAPGQSRALVTSRLIDPGYIELRVVDGTVGVDAIALT